MAHGLETPPATSRFRSKACEKHQRHRSQGLGGLFNVKPQKTWSHPSVSCLVCSGRVEPRHSRGASLGSESRAPLPLPLRFSHRTAATRAARTCATRASRQYNLLALLGITWLQLQSSPSQVDPLAEDWDHIWSSSQRYPLLCPSS